MEKEAVDETLMVVEEEADVRVSWASDADDWLVRFEKSSDFPAYDWASRMVQLYNLRQEQRTKVEP
jgi:hypothetical protein